MNNLSTTVYTKELDPLDRYYFLDYLRIFGMVSVFIGHKFQDPLISFFASSFTVLPDPVLFLLKLLVEGGPGLIVFFLVSGYIISKVLYQDSAPKFLIKRFFRIYPLYIFSVIVHNIILKSIFPDHDVNIFQIALQLSLLGDFFNVPYALSGIEWSLRVELIFYLFMAIIRYIMPQGLKKWFFLLLFSLVILCAVLPPIPRGTDEFLFNNYLLLYIPLLLIGSAFYLLELNKINTFIFILFVILVFSLHEYKIQIHDGNPRSVYYAILGVSLFFLAWKFQIKFPKNQFVLILSELTYIIYLSHLWLPDFMVYIVRLWFPDFLELPNEPWKMNYIFNLAVYLALFIAPCYLIHCLIEKPTFKFGKKICNIKIKDSQ